MITVTTNGKELKIVPIPGTRHYKIQFTTGGQLPEWMSGSYTSTTKAMNDVSLYLSQDQEKRKRKSDD